MRKDLLAKIYSEVIDYIGVSIPVIIAAGAYYIIEDSLFFMMSLYFILISKAQLETYQKLDEIQNIRGVSKRNG